MNTAPSTPNGRRRLRPRGRIVLAGIVAALAIAAVPAAWATFTDVPPANPFYNDINAIQGAGITSGCGGGNFCPADNIARQGEAAFIHRAAGRLGYDSGGATSNIPAGFTTPAGWSDTMTAGGSGGGTGFIKVDAAVVVCNYGAVPGFFYGQILIDNVVSNFQTSFMSLGGVACDNMKLVGAKAVSTGANHTIAVQIARDGADTAAAAAMDMTFTYYPFGGTGGNVLGETGSSSELKTLRPPSSSK